MSAGQRGARRLAFTHVISRDTVCFSCRTQLSKQSLRKYASAAAAVAEAPQRSLQDPVPATATGPRKAFRLMCSPVISRPPLLTRELTSFEKAYYFYQKRLNERLALPFTRYFYYKKGTPADVEWKRKYKARQTAARDVGVYNAYAEDGWNDEVLVGSRLSEPEDAVEKLIRDAEGKNIVDAKLVGDAETSGEAISGDAKAGEGTQSKVGEVAMERPLTRVTEADRVNDLKSLNRKLDRSLYLLVKNKDGRWRFPEDRIHGRENLHQAAERVIIQAGGINMNTWVVGNHPVAHYMFPYRAPVTSTIPPNRLVSTSTVEMEREEYGERVFFMKARIMAGQADLTKNEFGDQEFEWLTKEEIQGKVSQMYWAYIKNMLVER